MSDDRRAHSFDADETRDLEALGVNGGSVRRRPGCPDPALLVALDEGVLDEDVVARVRAHVSGCPACQAASADLAAVFDEGVPEESRKRLDARVAAIKPSRSRGLWYWLVPAGGLAAATAAIVWALLPGPVIPLVPDDVVAKAPAQALPTVFVVDRPALPPGEIDLAVRGAAETVADVANQASLALDRADGGDISGGLAEAEALFAKHRDSRKAGLALGSLLLRVNRNAESLTVLEAARALKIDPELNDEVDWFLAIASVRAGDRPNARLLLEGVCKRNGTRGARACAGVAEIDRLPSPR